MNDPLYLEELSRLPGDLLWIIEHVAPADFRATRKKLLPIARRLPHALYGETKTKLIRCTDPMDKSSWAASHPQPQNWVR